MSELDFHFSQQLRSLSIKGAVSAADRDWAGGQTCVRLCLIEMMIGLLHHDKGVEANALIDQEQVLRWRRTL